MSFLSQAIVTFREHSLKVTFRIFSANADDVNERLDMGLLDIGLLTEPVDAGKYSFCRMKEKDRWGVLVRADAPLAALEAVTPTKVAPHMKVPNWGWRVLATPLRFTPRKRTSSSMLRDDQ